MSDRNQALQQYTGWLYTVARGMTNGHLYEDLAQEGYIAMWRAMGTFNPDHGVSMGWWLKKHAINRMRDIRAGAKMTTDQGRRDQSGFVTKRGELTRQRITDYIEAHPGATGVQIARALNISEGSLSYHRSKMGTVSTAKNLTEQTVSVEAMMDAGWELECPDQLESVLFAYHAGDIYEALDVLTPAQRKYVIARFWDGKSFKELEQMFGYHPHSLWTTAKPKLMLRLGYLRELVDA